ncbi:lipid A-modifier LpxR family protein [Brevundimonas balnearis]|uniref:Lipid A-modifier LpxR family protein n=1 Tax=Brevundimonas balnearis TaxID=1572858 RepID=A0ABV6R2W5_9CAUL
MRAVWTAVLGGVVALAATGAAAQSADGARPYFGSAARISNDFDDGAPRRPARPSGDPVADLIVRLDVEPTYIARAGAPFGAPIEPLSPMTPRSDGLATATRTREVFLGGDGFTDRLRLTSQGAFRRADGSPLPPTPQFAGAIDDERVALNYRRGWDAARGETPSGLEVTLTPHAGVDFSDGQGALEAGATLRIGENLDDMVRDGGEAFGDRSRWYLYAAGSGRAVGYNWARTRDGDYARSGVSHDSGAFLGDASIGMAWRRGAVQSSVGVVYREIDASELRGEGFDKDVSEGLLAFQFSIKPE